MSELAVVTCVWQRPQRLAHTLEMLDAQTMPVDVWLINNNAALSDFVDDTVGGRANTMILHNAENHGPFARLEVIHVRAWDYAYFLTIDDDANFDPTWAERWWAQRRPDAVQGWCGFRFTGNYWQREAAQPGETCHYLWGSNLMVPAAAVRDTHVLSAPQTHWQTDDLWLCYHANHVAGLELRRGEMGIHIEDDGKDSYLKLRQRKIDCLEELRGRGWQV